MRTNLTIVFCTALAARYLPELVLNLRNRGRLKKLNACSRVKAYHIAAMWGLSVVAASLRLLSDAHFHKFLVPLGLSFVVLGCMLGLWALVTLAGSYSRELIVYEDSVLVQDGLYGVIRHPLRLGLAIEIVGHILIAAEIKLAIVLPVIVICQIYRSKSETNLLIESYGVSALQYTQSIPSLNIVAGIWRMVRRRKLLNR
jgi:protein-S-isoprenylcysteine O-methyltransferase Ste14